MNILCGLIFACLSLQARVDPPIIPASSIDYNEHSTITEYVAATSDIEDAAYVTTLTPGNKPIERYWMEDPVDSAAYIDEYNVGYVFDFSDDVYSTEAIPALVMKPAENGSFDFSIGVWGFKGPDEIVHYVQAKDWW
jgi:hypothetical protein